VSSDGLPDDPKIAQLPIRFAQTVLKPGFEKTSLPDEVPQLLTFAATFFLRLLKDEFDTSFTGFDDPDDREAVMGIRIEAEVRGARQDELPLLFVFDDYCDLFEEIGDGYSREETEIHEEDIIELTHRVLERIAQWAGQTKRKRLSKQATEAASQMEEVIKWLRT
jgi:hypothetical protein